MTLTLEGFLRDMANTGSRSAAPGHAARSGAGGARAHSALCPARLIVWSVPGNRHKRPALRTGPEELGSAHKTGAARTGTPGCHGNHGATQAPLAPALGEEWVVPTGVRGLPCLLPGFGVLFVKGRFRRRPARPASGRTVTSARQERQGHHAPPPAAARGARGALAAGGPAGS